MKSFSKWSLLLFAVLLVTGTLKADRLVLRDGRRIEGQLISIRNGLVEFDEDRGFGSGRLLRIDRGEVAGIQFDGNERSVYSPPPEPRGIRPSGLREKQVMVVAGVPWVDTTINVKAGQNVYLEADGEITWGPRRHHGPAGEPGSPLNPNRPMPNRPGAALIGRVGEDSTDYFFIGSDHGPIRMRSAGRLFLGVNDDYLPDNSGYFRVVIYY